MLHTLGAEMKQTRQMVQQTTISAVRIYYLQINGQGV
jgi:hypothetical protein